MGIRQAYSPLPSCLADALFPKVRQRVLAVLFGTPARSFYANEVVALAQSGAGAVQRELAGLSDVLRAALVPLAVQIKADAIGQLPR